MVISKNIDKYKVIDIDVKKIQKFIFFDDLIINKRKILNNSLTFSIPLEIYHHLKDLNNRSEYVRNLFEKFKILLRNVNSEIFFNISEMFRFFIYLDYLEYVNDLKIELNSMNLKKPVLEIKNGLISEIENGIEYLREYENNKIIKENKIKGMIK